MKQYYSARVGTYLLPAVARGEHEVDRVEDVESHEAEQDEHRQQQLHDPALVEGGLHDAHRGEVVHVEIEERGHRQPALDSRWPVQLEAHVQAEKLDEVKEDSDGTALEPLHALRDGVEHAGHDDPDQQQHVQRLQHALVGAHLALIVERVEPRHALPAQPVAVPLRAKPVSEACAVRLAGAVVHRHRVVPRGKRDGAVLVRRAVQELVGDPQAGLLHGAG
eukprot:3825101-Pyramimonas_sp.AAC.2